VHELRYLAASLSDESSLPEPTRVTVFMNGLNACEARTQLFRTYPQSFEEAVTTALSEEFHILLREPQKESPLTWICHMSLQMFPHLRTANATVAVRRAILPVVVHADNAIALPMAHGVDFHENVDFVKLRERRETLNPSRREAAYWGIRGPSLGE
jgi:hypothetical protein